MTRSAPLKTLLADFSSVFTSGALLLLSGRRDLSIVGIVRSGPAALEEFERVRPEVVLLDAVLPGLDGFRVARKMKSYPEPPFVAVVTFFASDEARREAAVAGADAFLAKDEFAEGLDLLVEEAIAYHARRRERLTSRETPVRLGSRTEPTP